MTAKMVNAWMLVIEDDPAGTDYNNPNSCYQKLIKDNIYRCVDLLYLGFAETVPTSAKTVPAGDGSSYTTQISSGDDHRSGLTNQDYMNYIMRDAKKSNPKIKIAVMLGYVNRDWLSQIFPDPAKPDAASADKFAANLMSYLKHYGLDGFDIDWEYPIASYTTQDQIRLLIDAIGAQFKRQTDKHYYLTLSPELEGKPRRRRREPQRGLFESPTVLRTYLPGRFQGHQSRLVRLWGKVRSQRAKYGVERRSSNGAAGLRRE